jgi:hypothetical protein
MAVRKISPFCFAGFGFIQPYRFGIAANRTKESSRALFFQVVNIEYLDLMHFDDERYIQILLDIFQYKYSKPKPDLIIPVFNSAVALVLKHGPDLFPGVPIVFGGVESKFVENRSLGPNVTGYLTDNNYTGTLDLALNLHPDTRHVAVVAGAGPIGRGHMKNVSILPI